MKIKRILLSVLALALVAALSVGATLAFLSDDDGQVRNKFTFASGMTVYLTEQKLDGDGKVLTAKTGNETITTNNTKGYDYTGIVPGQTLNKEPWIDFETDVDAYVFIKVDGFVNGQLDTQDFNTTDWTKLYGDTNTANGVYVYKQVVTPKDGKELEGVKVFSTVTVGNLTNPTGSLSDVTIDVYAIQALGFADASAALAETPFAPPAPTPDPAG